MKKEVMKIWVEALRSGKYKQGRGRLKDTSGGYCCLGVLCELAGEEHGKFEADTFYHYVDSEIGEDREESTLPSTIRKWADMQYSDGSFVHNDRTRSLAAMNDEGTSFQELADIIETNYEVL